MTNLIDPLSFFGGSIVKAAVAVPVLKRPVPAPDDSAPKRVMTTVPVQLARKMPGTKPTGPGPVGTVEALWVEKYKPRMLSDLVGNGSQIARLASWLAGWKPATTAERSVLLSGPPGIGKTSTAKLVCEQAGYSVLEFNASDTRGKNAVEEMASGLATNRVLLPSGQSSLSSRVAIIMDEVDGMSGGDRGGSAALIQMIKKSKLPIICICNDRQDTKIRSLANSCLDLRFTKPTISEVALRAAVVAKAENLSWSPSALSSIAESSNCDIRQVINSMQLNRLGDPGNVALGKDVALGPFEIVKGLFTSATARSWDYSKRNELFFLDYDLIPLLIQQNYLKCVENVADVRVWPALTKAAEYICFADSIGRAIRTDAHWNLLPEFGVMSTVGPSFACNNVLGYPEFPTWLGKQSSQNKNVRLMKELRGMVGTNSTTTSRNLKLSGYSTVLYASLVNHLRRDIAPIEATIAFIDAIGAPKDSLMEVLSESRLPWQPDLYGAIDSKTKAALTRAYNAKEHLVRAGNVQKISASRKKPDGDEADEEEEEDRSLGLIKVAKGKRKPKK